MNVTFYVLACAKHVYKQDHIFVRRGRADISTMPKQEVAKQIEVFLSNATTRIKQKRTTKN